jgi:hypothetical protein
LRSGMPFCDLCAPSVACDYPIAVADAQTIYTKGVGGFR